MPNKHIRDIIEAVVADLMPLSLRTFYGPFYSTVTLPVGSTTEEVHALRGVFEAEGLMFDVKTTGRNDSICLDDDEVSILHQLPRLSQLSGTVPHL